MADFDFFLENPLQPSNSEFGVDTANQSPDSPLYVKTLLHAELESLSLPYVLYNTGAFADWVPAILGPKDGKIVVVGTGETETSFTGIGDISRFVVHTLTSEWDWYVLYIRGTGG